MEPLSLYKLNNILRSVIESTFPETFLVTAEVASCSVKNHCYMTLVDKKDDSIRAEANAVIWANRYSTIAARFKKETGTQITKGIKILFEAEITYHERYGLKLNILDIDPSYTIGEMAVKRKEVLERLKKEFLIDRNRDLMFPVVPQKIGIISSSTAAGYDDFMNHLNNNHYGYVFTTRLFEAIMQGDRAEASINKALQHCAEKQDILDVVVIVRGGGAETDLHCFDSYIVGKAITLLPMPVISGIGHQRDITVVDEVSNIRAKTPTAAADIIISKVKDFEERLDASTGSLVNAAFKLVASNKSGLSMMSRQISTAAGQTIRNNSFNLDSLSKGLSYSLKMIKNEQTRVRAKESNIRHLNPLNILKRGYSITQFNGKSIRSSEDVTTGDEIKTLLFKGHITSTVKK